MVSRYEEQTLVVEVRGALVRFANYESQIELEGSTARAGLAA